jgi:hypothetical protein
MLTLLPFVAPHGPALVEAARVAILVAACAGAASAALAVAIHRETVRRDGPARRERRE